MQFVFESEQTKHVAPKSSLKAYTEAVFTFGDERLYIEERADLPPGFTHALMWRSPDWHDLSAFWAIVTRYA